MKIPKYIQFSLIFIFLAGIFAAIQYYIFGVPYAAKEEAPIALFAEIILSLIIVFYVRRYASWKSIGFGALTWKSLLWTSPLLIPSFIIAIIFLTAVFRSEPELGVALGIIITLVETFLIGFAEETAFRGILLQGALKKFNIFKAMIISAIGFSLLHSINVFAGYPVADTINQLGLTFLNGLFMAPLAIMAGNLWPLIISHFLWDFIGLAKVQLTAPLQVGNTYAFIQLAIPIIQQLYMLILWAVILIKWKKGDFRQ